MLSTILAVAIEVPGVVDSVIIEPVAVLPSSNVISSCFANWPVIASEQM
ncbi:MAG: hypothetical protein H0V78_03215 [Burkholderiales bacterium]|nr:hypothetical protein [Burkholderiales bacterium]